MKAKGIKPPQETMKNKFDTPVFKTNKVSETVPKMNSFDGERPTLAPNLVEIKISNERRFVMDTEF